mmetsp:Transcript_14071/g.39861  ORF Transcript_14071/g.39861 Transcript_14071/m.39861 type:complete len:292 (-) Transcript_14071:355-1230(-)
MSTSKSGCSIGCHKVVSRLVAVLLATIVLGGVPAAPTGAAGRRVLPARPFHPGKQCQNIADGPWMAADDRGFICQVDEVDSNSGCCMAGEKHSCHTCLEEDKCCAGYEHCVSCCMREDHTTPDAVANIWRSENRPETGHWGNLFELCRGKCRTTKHSTVHENGYLGRRHHCFGERSRPLLNPKINPLPPNLLVAAADNPNLNCHQVCANHKKTCSPDHFSVINNCDRLRDFFSCEAGCELDTQSNRGPDHPAYVIYTSPKETLPTMCLTNDSKNYECGARHAKTRRLCPCV